MHSQFPTPVQASLAKRFKGSFAELAKKADETLSQKALRGATDVSQSLMCLRVANKLRAIVYHSGLDIDQIAQITGQSDRLLWDINYRSVLVSREKLARVELALDAFSDEAEEAFRAGLLVGDTPLDRDMYGCDMIPVK